MEGWKKFYKNRENEFIRRDHFKKGKRGALKKSL